MPSFTPRAIAVSCAAAVAVPTTLFLLARAFRRPHEYNGPSYSAVPTCEWSTRQVAQWLRSRGVSEAAVASFQKNEVDGRVLLLLEESHITTLAPKLRDNLLIRDGLQQLRGKTSASPLAVQAALPTPPLPQAPLGGEELIKTFLNTANDICATLTSQEFEYATPEEQERERQLCMHKFHVVVDEVRKLAPEVMTKLLPIANKVERLIAQSDKRDASTTLQVPPALGEQLKTLHDMIDGFLRVLSSPGMDVVTDPQVVLLRERIESQINHVLEVVQRLPPQYGDSLAKKCNMVLQKIHQKPRVEVSRVLPQSQQQVQPREMGSQSQSMPDMILLGSTVKRLRDIFTFLRSSQLMEMNPPERLLCIEEMVKEVKEIQETASSWNDARAIEVINQVGMNVVEVLEQIGTLTREELNESNGGSAEETEEAQGVTPQMELPHIFASLQAIIQVLQSEEFTGSPLPVRIQVVAELQRSLRQLRFQIGRLPVNQTTATVSAMMGRTEELLESLAGRQPNAGGGREQRDEAEEEEEGRGDDNVDPRTSSTNPLEAVWRDKILDEVVSELEQIFEYVNSEAFEMLPAVEKADMAQKELSHLLAIEERCTRFGGLGQLQDLVDPFKQLLQQEVNKRPAATSVAPTPLFLSISSHLQRMSGILESEGFKNAEMSKKRTAAQSIMSQLQKLNATLSELPPHERVLMQKLIAPISASLQQIVMSREETLEYSGDPRQLVGRVEGVLTLLQSQEFRNASPEQRQQIAVRLLEALGDLEEECGRIGGAAVPLLPIIQRLQRQMQAFTRVVGAEEEGRQINSNNSKKSLEGGEEDEEDDDLEENAEEKNQRETAVDTKDKDTAESAVNDEGAPAEEVEQSNSQGGERQKLFSAVSEITEELSRSTQSNLQLSEEELRPLLGLLEMVDSVGVATVLEKKLRDEFEDQIKRAGGEVSDVSAAEASNVEVQNLIRFFVALKERLVTLNTSSLSDLLPLMNIAERTLSAADQQNIPWRESSMAINLITEVLSLIQALQGQLSENQQASELGNILNEAAKEVREHPPQNEEQLQPYLQILSGVQNNVNCMSVGALEAFKDLQEAVLTATRTLSEDSQMAERLMSDNDPSAELLLEISNRLREESFPDVILEQYAMLLDRIESADARSSIHEAIQAVREQLHLQQISNRNNANGGEDSVDDDGENEGSEEHTEEEKEERDEHDSTTEARNESQDANAQTEKPSHNQEGEKVVTNVADIEHSSNAPQIIESTEKETLNPVFKKLPTKYVPGGDRNELLLLPRIEKKMFSDEQHFIEHTTLSDIQNISKVILHLEINGEVRAQPKLNDRVVRVKKAFARQLEAFHESDQKSVAVLPTLRLRCKDTVVLGESVRKLMICTDAEVELSDEGNNNSSQDIVKFLTEGSAAQATVPQEVIDRWKGRSVAVLVCEATVAEGTALSELVLLHEVLSTRYGFNVVTVGSTSASEMRNLLKEIALSGVNRLFLYYAMSLSASCSPHTVLFRDGSGFTYRDALQQVGSIDRVVLAHSQPQELTVVPALSGSCDTFFSIEVTEAARDKLRPARCWLYDGLLTPAVTELLSLDEWRMLCPEDLATYAVTAMTSLSVDFGSFVKGAASSMGFFVPFNTSE